MAAALLLCLVRPPQFAQCWTVVQSFRPPNWIIGVWLGGVVIALKGVCSLVVSFGSVSGNMRVELWFGMRPTGNVLGSIFGPVYGKFSITLLCFAIVAACSDVLSGGAFAGRSTPLAPDPPISAYSDVRLASAARWLVRR